MTRWAAIALVLVGGVAHANDADEALIASAQRIATDQALLPPFSAEVLPGTFAEQVAPFLPALREASHRLFKADTPEDAERVDEVILGKRPLADLPEFWREELRLTHDALAGVLRASHARSARLPRDLQLFPFWEVGPTSGVPLERAIRLAVLQARAAAEAHQGGEAARICLEGIAVARALGHGYLVPRMLGEAELPHLAQGCGASVSSMDEATLVRFQGSLKGLIASWTPLSWTFEQESMFGQLAGFGFSLDDDLVARLPKDALALVHPPSDAPVTDEGPPSLTGRVRRALFGSWARRRYAAAMARWSKAVDDPRADREELLAELADDLSLPYRLLGEDGAFQNFGKYVRLARERKSALVGLLAVTYVARFQREHAAWPASLAEAGFPSRWVDLSTGQPLRLERKGGSLEVVAGKTRLSVHPMEGTNASP